MVCRSASGAVTSVFSIRVRRGYLAQMQSQASPRACCRPSSAVERPPSAKLRGARFLGADLAHQGRTAEGYAVLLEGCARAQEASAGQPWEAALLERWRGVLERYGERWPVGRA